MLREMDFTEITIKDLTDRALINRKTFYLHYSSLDDLLGRLQTELLAKLLQSATGLKLPQDLEKLMHPHPHPHRGGTGGKGTAGGTGGA